MIEVVIQTILLKRILKELRTFFDRTVWVFDENGLEFRGISNELEMPGILRLKKEQFEGYKYSGWQHLIRQRLTLGIVEHLWEMSEILKSINGGTVTIKVHSENINQIEFILTKSVTSICPSIQSHPSIQLTNLSSIPFGFIYLLNPPSPMDMDRFFNTPEPNYVCEFGTRSLILKSICKSLRQFSSDSVLLISVTGQPMEVQFSISCESLSKSQQQHFTLSKNIKLQHPLVKTSPLQPVSSSVSNHRLNSIAKRMASYHEKCERYPIVQLSLSPEGFLRLVYCDGKDLNDRADMTKSDNCDKTVTTVTFYLASKTENEHASGSNNLEQ